MDVKLMERFVTVNGVSLHVLDWGGCGPDLLLVHGMGDSPWIFDDLARALHRDFRVLAYARRGHGQSDPAGPFDTDTLVADLVCVLDSMKIQQAHLLGWSMGGNEITAFAARYPERTLGLVYLEAGYDWSDNRFWTAMANCPIPLEPGADVLQSLDAFRTWARTYWLPDIHWSDGLERHLEQVTRQGSAGDVTPIPGKALMGELVAGMMASPRDYTGVRAPSLALYSPRFFMPDASDIERQQAMADWDEDWISPFRQASREKISRELNGVVIREIPDRTHGTIGVKDPEGLAGTIGDFLLGCSS